MNWLRLFFFCKHENVRCIHGDEINARNGRRVLCLDCGGALNGDLPGMCFYGGRPHFQSTQ